MIKTVPDWLEDQHDIEAAVVAVRSMADRCKSEFYAKIADRMAISALAPAVAV